MIRRYRSPLLTLVAAFVLLGGWSPREAGAQTSPDITNLPATIRVQAGVTTVFTCLESPPGVTVIPQILPAFVTYNDSTRACTINATSGDIGSVSTIIMDVDDNTGPVVQDTLVIQVNRPPTLNPVADQIVAEGDLLSLTLVGADIDGDPLTYALNSGPAGAAVDAGTGNFTWTPGFSDAGVVIAGVSVSDGLESAATSINITVTNTNRNPVVDPIADVTANEGDLVTVTPSAIDPDGDPLTWTGTSLPGTASVNGTSGALTWQTGFADAGTYPGVTLTANDGIGGTGSSSFQVTINNVNQVPTVAPIADVTANEGDVVTVTPVGSDLDGDPLSWSGSTLPGTASVDAGTGALSWTTGFSDAGSYPGVTLTADDGNGGTASASFAITINNVNQVPTVAPIADVTANEGDVVTVTPVGSDLDGDPLTWTGSSLPGTASVDAGTGALSWTTGFSDAGSYPGVTLTADDGNGGTASASFMIDVTNVNGPPVVDPIADVTANEGDLVTVTPTATDPDGDPLTWSGSNLPVDATVDAGTGAFSWQTDLTDAGVYANVTLTADDGNAGPGSASFSIDVNNTNQSPTVDPIADVTAAEGALISVTPTGSDPDMNVLSWSGSSLPGTASVNATTGELTWQTGSLDAGSYPGVTLTANDGNGGTASASFMIDVTNVNASPVVDPIADVTASEGDLVTVTPSATDADGDPLTWSGSNLPTGATVDAGTGAFSWQTDLADAGVYSSVTLTADDGTSSPGSASFTITINNVNQAPTVSPLADVTANEGDLVTVTPSGSDPDGDALSWTGSSLPAGATVDAGTGELSWQTGFNDAGSYPGVTLTADDGNGGTASASFMIDVTNTNRAPVVDPIADVTVTEGDLVTVTPSGSDPDGDALTWSGSSLPGSATVDAGTGVLTWQTMTGDAGVFSGVTLIASDGALSSSQMFTITVEAPTGNQPPVFTAVANQTLFEGQKLVVALNANDPDASDDLHFSLISILAGINPPPAPGPVVTDSTSLHEGTLSWKPMYNTGTATYTVKLRVADPSGATDSTSFTVTVTNNTTVASPPAIALQADTTIAELALSTIRVVGSDNNTVNTLQWQLTVTPAAPWLTLAVPTGTNTALVGTPPANAAGAYGVRLILAEVSAPTGRDTMQFVLTVTDVNSPPVLAAIPPQSGSENALLTFTATAVDPDGDPITYGVTGNPAGSTIDSGSGVFTWMPDFNAADRVPGGNYGGTVVSASDGTGTSTQSVAIHINDVNRAPVVDAIADATIDEGALFTVTATATDPDTLSSITGWSRSGDATGASIDNAGVYTWTPDFTQGGATYAETVTATDNAGGTGNATFSLTVTNVNRAPVVDPIADVTAAEGDLVTVTPSATDPDGDPLTWSGSNLPAGATVDAGTGVLSWQTQSGDAGTYSGVTLTASDGSLSSSASFTITITAPANGAPVVDPIADVTAAEGDLVTVMPTATDPDGDPLTWSGSNLPAGATVDAGAGAFTWQTGFSDAGTYSSVTLTADDGISGAGSASFTITITNTNRAPVVQPIADATVMEGQLLTVTPSGSDADGDVLTWSGSSLPAGATVDVATGTLTWTPDNTAGETNGGTYAGVTLSASDGTATGSASFTITVTDQAPVITTTAVSFCAGETAMESLSATDDDGGALTWAATGMPTWLSLDANTGVLTGSPDVTDFGYAGTIDVTATDAVSGAASTSTVAVAVDCTPVHLVNTVTSSEPFNRHRIAASPYTVTFAVDGDVRPEQITASHVALEFAGARVLANTVQVQADHIVANFDRSALAGLMADLASGETAHLALVISSGNFVASTQLNITVTGIQAAAAAAVVQNPVRTAARVQYTAPEDGRVSVAVYNANGRLVQTLIDEVVTAGRYETIWNTRDASGQNVPSGVYYLRATMAGERVVNRLLIMR